MDDVIATIAIALMALMAPVIFVGVPLLGLFVLVKIIKAFWNA